MSTSLQDVQFLLQGTLDYAKFLKNIYTIIDLAIFSSILSSTESREGGIAYDIEDW